ncbi:MAG: class I SAM-dependent methyltransferase [Tepidiformaceae bacterium]
MWRERAHYDPLLFAGTAWYYARYRPGPPSDMCRHLAQRLDLDARARVLDLGCGTGQVALEMAPLTGEVVGMDPDSAMLVEAARIAAERAITNVTWVSGSSWDLGASLGGFRLVTMAQSFHWMDRPATIAALDSLVEPGGAIALLNSSPGVAGSYSRALEVSDQVVRELFGPERRAGGGVYLNPPERHDAIFHRSAFPRVEVSHYPYRRAWTIDQVVGNVFSSSACAPHLLGGRGDAFERALRERLAAICPAGGFVDEGAAELEMFFRAEGEPPPLQGRLPM